MFVQSLTNENDLHYLLLEPRTINKMNNMNETRFFFFFSFQGEKKE